MGKHGVVVQMEEWRSARGARSRGKFSFPAFNGSEEIEQRLNGLNARVTPVPVHKLSRQRLGNAGFGGNGLPKGGPGSTKVALKVGDDGFHAPILFPPMGKCQPTNGKSGGQSSHMELEPADTLRKTLGLNLSALMRAKGLGTTQVTRRDVELCRQANNSTYRVGTEVHP